MLARLTDVSQPQVGDAQPEMEFMIVGVAIDLLGEEVPRGLEVAQLHGVEPAVEEMECPIGLDLCQPALHDARFGHAPQPLQRQSQVRQGLGVLGFALEDMAEDPLGLRPVGVAQVDDAERVVGAQERGVPPDCRARPPVGVIRLPPNEQLGGAVVHVHRNDGRFSDDPGSQHAQLFRRQEVDRQELAGPCTARPAAEREVDVSTQEIHAADPAPSWFDERALVLDRQPERLGEGCGHDDQGKAVAGSCFECLRRVSGDRSVVLEPELVLAVQRLDQPHVQALAQQGAGHLGFQVALHLIAKREHVLCADALGGSREQVVAEQLRGRLRHRRVGARGEQHAQP